MQLFDMRRKLGVAKDGEAVSEEGRASEWLGGDVGEVSAVGYLMRKIALHFSAKWIMAYLGATHFNSVEMRLQRVP